MAVVVGFTVVPFGSLASATTLGESFLQHHPQGRFIVVFSDYPLRVSNLDSSRIEFIRADSIPTVGEMLPALAMALDQPQLIAYLRPLVAEYICSLEQDALILCFDSQVEIFAPLSEFISKLEDHDIGVIPRRITSLPNDGLNPSSTSMHHCGLLNTGIFGVNASSDAFINWWKVEARLQKDVTFPTDFSFLDFASTIFRTYVCNDPTYGVSYWNLDERELTEDGSRWLINGQLLKLAYFKNFDWRHPYWATNDVYERPRIRMGSNARHKQFYSQYASRVESHFELVENLPTDSDEMCLYGWDYCFPGIKISPSLRFIYRAEWCLNEITEKSSPPSPFGNQNIQDFIDWINGETLLKDLKVQRFVLSIFIDRPDIRRDFVRGPAVNHAGFQKWLFDFARAEVPISRYTTFKYSHRRIENLGRSRQGVDIIGSLNSEHGLGEAGRLLVSAIEQTPEDISTIAFVPAGVRAEHEFEAKNESKNYTTVIALNPEQIRDLWNDYGDQLRANRYVIGQWFWELEMAPSWYADAFSEHAVDELWAPTRFIEAMLRNAAPPHVPVLYMPLPFASPEVDKEFTFQSVGVEEKFTFLFTFDFGSVMKRKNPDGAIEAFKKAFAPNEGPQLIIKSINGDTRPREFEQLMWARDGRNDIVLLDKYLDNDENAALISLSDCYVSLHRSEGLGLTMAEAMLLKKPVIATGYSGNLDFMNTENSYLVPWKYTLVGSGADAYPRNAKWAEPDLNEAARLMRYVYENQDAAREVGERARTSIEMNFSTKVTGERMHKRLKELRGNK